MWRGYIAIVILLFSDYGLEGPYLGQVESVIAELAPQEKIINLMSDAPRNNPKASSYLLYSLIENIPVDSIVFAVVDPGVGTNVDKPVVVRAHERWYVGPDNGLFDLIIRTAEDAACWEIIYNKENISNSFHGRDVYAPECAYIANHDAASGDKIDWQDKRHFPDCLNEVIYIDHFGNCLTGIANGVIDIEQQLNINGRYVAFASTFGHVEIGQPFWYINSNRLLEIAVNQGNAKEILNIDIGTEIII